MKLISILFSKRALVAMLLQLTLITYGNATSSFNLKRVFWNKFEAEITHSNTVVLTWNVTEYNNKSFSVQYSINGNDWEDIDLVMSQQSAESMTDYSYQHKNNRGGRQFYRLKALDLDNKSKSVSPVVSVLLEENTPAVAVWPNPAISHIVITNTNNGDKYTKASILDMSGKIMIESQLKSGLTEIAVNNLLRGIYFVILEDKNGTKNTQRFIKQ